MNLWQEFWKDPYRFLWSRIGGRPFTYVARDIYHKFEYIVLVTLFVGGFTVGWCGLVSWKWLGVLMGVYTIGFIHGHFFWGREYIPGQTENYAQDSFDCGFRREYIPNQQGDAEDGNRCENGKPVA